MFKVAACCDESRYPTRFTDPAKLSWSWSFPACVRRTRVTLFCVAVATMTLTLVGIYFRLGIHKLSK